ncbi:MAG: hypothetical protein HC901_01190 [Bdellovibrionaceae bacterium]|nr:hypothetical protein [Pseudobdellovibrionaceae bacterium]
MMRLNAGARKAARHDFRAGPVLQLADGVPARVSRTFPNQLAVEKWWTLQQVYFAGRDPLQLWTPEESWRRLDQALRTSVAIRGKLTELPVRADVSLQAIIREWELVRFAKAEAGTQ